MDESDLRIPLLDSIDSISSSMHDIIYSKYYYELGGKNKYVLSLFDDAYRTSEIICYAFSKVGIIQVGMLLRQLLVTTSVIKILVKDPNLIDIYTSYYKFKKKVFLQEDEKIVEKIKEEFKLDITKKEIHGFLDYGWIKGIDKPTEAKVIKYAGFSDVGWWRDNFLNKMAHNSFLNNSFIGDDYDFPIIKKLLGMFAELFDYICYYFYKFTNYEFVINNNDFYKNVFQFFYKQYADLTGMGFKSKEE